jgi:hypothetical protein
MFHLYSVGMAMETSHQRSILQIRKPREVLIYYENQCCGYMKFWNGSMHLTNGSGSGYFRH